MRAVRVTRFGGPEVLTAVEVPDPEPGPGEVVIGVAAADVLFLETRLRQGDLAEPFGLEPPYTPGGAVAGEVLSVGEGVDPELRGRRVVARTGVRGGYAERTVAAAGALVPVPDGLDLRTAAALLHDGPTALALFDETGVRAGHRVLITAAAGGMGALLVQLARSAGAQVTAAARGERKLALVRELGADQAVDYAEPGWEKRVRETTGGRGADVTLDGAGGAIGRAAFEATADGGRFSAHGAPGGGFVPVGTEEAAARGITLTGIELVQLTQADADRLVARALAEAAAGRIAPVVGQTFPLDRAADAHRAIESRAVTGKTLLLP